MKRLFLILMLALLCAFVIYGQQPRPQPDSAINIVTVRLPLTVEQIGTIKELEKQIGDLRAREQILITHAAAQAIENDRTLKLSEIDGALIIADGDGLAWKFQRAKEAAKSEKPK